MIVSQLAKELGLDFGYEMSASAVFLDIAKNVPAYEGLRYPLLKDETNPVQVKHQVVTTDVSAAMEAVQNAVDSFPDEGEKIDVTPDVGTELFRLGMLTDKVPQFHLLASGNPRPETTAISPLYQITITKNADFPVPIANLTDEATVEQTT